ncbi:MAG: single-stranded DNA-binding protein [Ruminococcus sp.]|nr:single-stranded DNA-binding protein [Ruminococcus sp.]
MNKVILMGRLTADPELKQTQSGISTCRFTVAVNRKYADKNSGERQADFVTCTAWRQTAEFVSRYFSKGKMIALEGTLRTGSYTDRNHSDVTHYTTEVYVENVEFCGSKADNDSGYNNTAPTPAAAQNVVQQAQTTGVQTQQVNYGDLSDFEALLDDGDVPF